MTTPDVPTTGHRGDVPDLTVPHVPTTGHRDLVPHEGQSNSLPQKDPSNGYLAGVPESTE